jgi:hypothetical protein
MDEADTLSLAAFARKQGWKPSYVTELKKSGRLVLTEDGRVRVAASVQLIADTRNPDKAGVAARHAAARDAGTAATSSAPAATTEAEEGQGGSTTRIGDDPLSQRRALAQAQTEEAKARKALRDEAVELGQLLRVDDVLAVVANAITTLRSDLDNVPPTLAPALAAETDEDRVRVLLQDALESVQREAARRLEALCKGVA